MVAIDFFCGAGGLTRGLLNAGVRVVVGVDSDEGCRRTYEANNRPATFLAADIRALDVRALEKHMRGMKREDMLFAACAPCQPFTKLRIDPVEARQRTLLAAFGRLVGQCQPGHILLENVPGLADVPGASTYNRFLRILTRAGYQYCQGIVDAKAYGVAQTRRRLVLMAARGYKPELPPPTHGPGLRQYVTVRDAIGTYPRLRAGETHPRIPNHSASELSTLNVERMRHTPADGGDRRSWPDSLLLPCHAEHEGHTDVYGRMWWDRTAPAITCRCNSLSNGRYGHPSQNRAISFREAASLQSFARSYVFYAASQRQLAGQIGNAVPVRLAEALGKHLIGLHQRHVASRARERPRGRAVVEGTRRRK